MTVITTEGQDGQVYDTQIVPPIDLTPLNLASDEQEIIELGRNAYLFGAFLDPIIKAGIDHVADGSMEQKNVGLALSTIAKLYSFSGEDYKGQQGKLTGLALTAHQGNVLSGKIVLVDPEMEMNETNRLSQLTRANEALSKLPPEIQAIIAELNYEVFFRPQTMAGGAETRGRNELDTLLASLGKDQNAMPHLTLTNWAIGDIAEGVYSSTGVRKLDIIDTGSGPGGTIATITDRLLQARKRDHKDLSITCIETTQGFYDQLKSFTENDDVITNLGLRVRSLGSNVSKNAVDTGTLTTVKSDALSALRKIDFSSLNPNDVILISGNYSWHRLDERQKQEIMNLFANVPNVIFLVGDFANHGNPVAKQYFCLGANGPLNVGNIGLGEQFTKSGYYLADLRTNRPESLDERFAKKIVSDDQDPNVDGHLWIAYKGELAEQALNLV